MKILNPKIFALALVVMLSHFSIAQGGESSEHPFQFLSPLPSSKLHLPEAFLVIRDGQLDYSDFAFDEEMIVVEGSQSGVHEFELRISRKGKTLNVIPKIPFELGESVTVNLYEFPGPQGNFDFNWSFEVTPEIFIYPQEEVSVSNPRTFEELTLIAQSQTGMYDAPIFTQVQGGGGVSSYGILPPEGLGDPLFCLPGGPTGLGADFKRNRNGLPTTWENEENRFVMFNPEMQIEREFVMVAGYTADEHDFQIMPDGHYFLFAYDMQPVNMALVVDGGDPDAMVEGYVIQEFDYDDVLLFQWRTWDFLNITDNEDQNLSAGIITPFHVNALEIDSDGHIFTSSRHTNEIMKIHRFTGEVMWRWTINSYGDFDFVNDIGFSYQHDSRRLDNGNILLFDNANLTGQLSRAVEYELDTVAWTATKVWEYIHPDNLFGSSRGGAFRCPNGNTMIAWGQVSSDDYGFRIQEVGPNGQNILEFAFPLGNEGYRAPKQTFDPDNWIGGCGDVDAPNYDPSADYWLPEFCQQDADGDGFSVEMGDCNENDDTIYPGAEEIPNDGIDQDCNGEDLVVVEGDDDADGFTEEQGDCNDDDDSIYPGAEEIPYDGIDQDCDGEDLTDVDGDGYSPEDGDCDDNNEDIGPDAEEIPYDGIDQDCDGEDLTDVDGDGYSPEDGDCDDENEDIGPDAEEIPYDGIDQDCDGEDLTDVDGDGFSPDDGDCDDDNEEINPGAVEIPNDGIDQDCDGEDLVVSVLEKDGITFSSWSANESIYLKWAGQEDAEVEVFDVSGRLISAEKIYFGVNVINQPGSSGMYILNVRTKGASGSMHVMIN